MSMLKELYQETILDHNRSPRNFHIMEEPDRKVEGYNPLCGDHYTVFVRLDGDVIREVSFQGAGCAISKASASLMSTALKGKTVAEAEELFHLFHAMVKGESDPSALAGRLGKLVAFAGVSEFPARVKCASLPWHTVHEALTGKSGTVTTE